MKLESTRLWISVLLVACTSLVVCHLGDFRIAGVVSKLAASAGFLVVAASAGAFHSRYGRILFAGLVCAAIGDMLLLGETKQLFLLGLVSFLLAHLIYVAAFFSLGFNTLWSLRAAIPLLLISLAVSAWLAPYVNADMLVPVRVYTFVISVMVITAFGTRGAGGPMIIPLGALLFYFSDLSVAVDRFVQPDFPNYVWGLPFYYSGQVLLALSVATGKLKSKPA